MDTLYLKIKIKKSDKLSETLRDQGHFFDWLAESLDINKNQIEEIDDANLEKSIAELIKYWR